MTDLTDLTYTYSHHARTRARETPNRNTPHHDHTAKPHTTLHPLARRRRPPTNHRRTLRPRTAHRARLQTTRRKRRHHRKQSRPTQTVAQPRRPIRWCANPRTHLAIRPAHRRRPHLRIPTI